MTKVMMMGMQAKKENPGGEGIYHRHKNTNSVKDRVGGGHKKRS